MRKITLLIFCVFTFIGQLSAQVAIGTGTLETENAPFEPFYGYSYTQTVYLASEINASGTITDIQWYYSGTSELPDSQELVVYMAESTKASFASTSDWEPIDSFTEVYSGGITVTAGVSGWVQITLDTPFDYSGTDNLLIAVEENMPSYDSSGDDFYNSEVATNRTISYYNDNNNPDPASPPTANNIDNTIPNIILGGITQSCPTPSGLTVSEITSTGASLGWTENGSAASWNIEVVPAGSVPTGTATQTGVGNPYTVSDLMAITGYDFYVQADCDTEESAWAGPFSFTTLCDVFIPDYLAPFDSWLQDCWEEADSGDPTTGPGNLGAGSWTTDGFANNGFTGAYKINLWQANKSDWLVSPMFDLTGGPFQVELDLAIMQFGSSTTAGTLGSDDEVQLLMTTDNGATWEALISFDNTSALPVGGDHFIYDLTAYSGMTVQFGIWASEGSVDDTADNDVSVDNFQVRAIPTCMEPSGLTASEFTSNGANLGWTENGDASLWNIEVVPAGTAPTGTPTASGVTNPTTVSDLSAITEYEFYVQSDCGDGDLSSWTGPFSFTTLCDVFIPDYLAPFDSWLQDCWEEADSGDPTTGPGNLGAGSWTTDGFANNGFTGAYKINLWQANKSDWLVSPMFDLTGGPFQVELDLAIMQFGSSTTAGTLGSDDEVQLLITTDSGATWTPILTWDNTTVNPVGGDHFIYNLSDYSGMIVQFGIWASEGSVDDTTDNDVSVDNFEVRAVPTCPEPSGLTATNLGLTSTEVAWTENGDASLWNIEYGPAGFELGTESLVTGVTNPYTLMDLTPDTQYDYYVQADCGDPDGVSSWTGPFTFYTGYCESEPSSNDGNGVGSVQLGIVMFPSFGDVTYENHTATVVNAFQGFNTNLQITFETGFTYDTNVWIDFDDNLVFDADELVYQGESTNANPTTLDASFMMPADAPLGEHRMRIGTADSGQSTPNPCYNGSWGVTLDFTVNIVEPTCINAEANYTLVDDCENGDQFLIDVDILSLGDATSLTVSNNYDANTAAVTETGVYQVGPFPFMENIVITVSNDQDSNCVIVSSPFYQLGCPPDNDNPCDAIVVDVNDNDSCDLTTSGTILAATDSGVPAPTCGGNVNDDVWFEFTALNEVQLITLLNISGGTFNLDHAVYEGTCDGLVELYCSTNTASITPELVIGNTYFVRVFSFGSADETTTFDLCIKQAPENTVCENATPFCGEGGALYASNVIGIPSTGPVACLGSIPNPTWNVLQIGESGPINIQIVQNTQFDENGNPTGTGLDVDFVLWGPFDNEIDYCDLDLLVDCPTCPNNTWNPDFYPFENIVDCSYSAAAVENVTIENAIAGEIYVLLVTNFNGGAGTIQIEQTNASDDGSGSITSEIEVELGEDQSFCGFPSYELNAESPFADNYEWYADGFIIEGENSANLTVTETATYTVIAYDENCDTQAQDEVTIIFGLEPIANAVEDIVTCDDASADEIEDFDLEMQTSGILAGQDPALFNVTYHTSLEDAQAGTNALTSPYTNVTNPQTIYVRIEDANATFCFATTTFDLVISGPTPTVTNVNFNVCDDESGDGVESFDLTSLDAEVLNGQDPSIYLVSYYASEADADAGVDPLVSPYENTSNPQTIYVRIESNVAYDCYSVGEVVLAVDAVPFASFNSDVVAYEVCPDATVPIEISLITEGFNEDEVTVEWSQDGGPIEGESGLTLPVLTEGTYTAIITSDASGCSYEVSADVIELESCEFPQGISPNGDGLNDNFNLSSFGVSKIEIFNRLGTLVYSKNDYTDQWYGQSHDGEELPVGTYFYTIEYRDGRHSAWVYINK
ncbi:fibronectin type III domain-containing protein [Mangrovimonas sp. YM274]|uniref:fibronectin type III domain-containing protein n=1 Tax=Mangrovimonas sp. YM274 TaxID=3070660 RepID=UPI0027DB22E4|nr:fibronectin type III domain-containing protein [Mangrovimonas sp. YM274]WMI68774.1 fibronectin type III domain-containing protein [Mangrovimonas sp. YM274]